MAAVGELSVPISGYHTSGLKYNLLFGSERSLDLRLIYGHDSPQAGASAGHRSRLQFDLSPISEGMQSENLLYVR